MPDNYPDMLKLKEKEAALDQNMKLYTTIYQDYLQLVKDRLKKCDHKTTASPDCLKNVGKDDLARLKTLNSSMVEQINGIKDLLSKIYPKGIENQKKINTQDKHLLQVIQDLEGDRKRLEKLIAEKITVTATNDRQTLERNSYAFEYAGLSIAALAALFITFKQIVN